MFISRHRNPRLQSLVYLFLTVDIIFGSRCYIGRKFICHIVFIIPNIHICTCGVDFPRGMKIGKRVEKQKERMVPTVFGGETRGARCKTKEAWSRHWSRTPTPMLKSTALAAPLCAHPRRPVRNRQEMNIHEPSVPPPLSSWFGHRRKNTLSPIT